MKNLARRGGAYLAIAVGFIFGADPATALAEGTSGVSGPHGDTIPALIVILLVALGLVLLCRPTGRFTESKLEKLDEE